jgi:hypothetical protein
MPFRKVQQINAAGHFDEQLCKWTTPEPLTAAKKPKA